MDLQTSIEQVAGILHRADLQFHTSDDGDRYMVPFGDDAVLISFGTWGCGVAVTVASPVLQDIDDEGAGAAVASQRLGDLNRRHRFVKWMFDDGDLICACDLLGDTLCSDELLNAVYTVARSADVVADDLQEVTGGMRFAEACECAAADDDIPF